MTKLICAVLATLGASFGGEVPREWVTVYHAFDQSATPKEMDWMEYYREFRPTTVLFDVPIQCGLFGTINVPFPYTSTYCWAVPNSLLSGPPSGPLLPFPPFPNFDPYPQTEPPAK